MRKTLIAMIAVAITLSMIPGCKDQKPAAGTADALATKYAKRQISVYKDSTLKTWSSTLEKGEPVELLSEETFKNAKKQDINVSKVKLSDDTVAYIDSRFLAVKPVVFVDANVKVYNRNNINSGEYAVIPAGTLGFVIDEKADWVQVDIGEVGTKKVYSKWVKGGITDSAEIVADAVSLEKIRAILSETAKGDKEEALNLLRTLAQKSNAISEIAKADLSKIEGSENTGTADSGQNNSAEGE